MVARQASFQSLKSIAGAMLLAFGLVVLFANIDEAAATMSSFSGILVHEGLGLLPALGMAGLQALQAYAFDQAGFISGLMKILVSFWPLVLIFVGAVVLRHALGRRPAVFGSPQAPQQLETNDVGPSR